MFNKNAVPRTTNNTELDNFPSSANHIECFLQRYTMSFCALYHLYLWWKNKINLSSLEKYASVYILAKFQKHTYNIQKIHCNSQLKWTLVAVKHQQFVPCYTLYDYRGWLSISKDQFLHIPCTVICSDLKTLLP